MTKAAFDSTDKIGRRIQAGDSDIPLRENYKAEKKRVKIVIDTGKNTIITENFKRVEIV